MYFENDVVQVDLDESYVTHPHSARSHVEELLDQAGVKGEMVEPKNFTASTLPDIPTNFDYMCCPRSISDLSSKIGLGYLGPRVRRIVRSSHFPVLLTSPVYKKWKAIGVFFGGSTNAVHALKLGLRINRLSHKPIDVFTFDDKKDRSKYEKIIEKENLTKGLNEQVREWHILDSGTFEEKLYDVPHDALLVLGAFGHGIIRDIVFGSKMEKIQSTVTNNLLVVGPKYRANS
jgi:hypothetical protein